MSDNRNDVGMWVGLGIVSAAMIWVVSKPRRILVAIAILGIGAFWADREDQRTTQVSADNRERKAHVEEMEEEWRLQADPIEWLQRAILMTQWENYLGAINEVRSSKYWTGEGVYGSNAGNRLSKLVTHSNIERFVNTVLVDVLSHPLFNLRDPIWDNRSLMLYEEDALKILCIQQDSSGMYHWNGSRYARYTYEGRLSPVIMGLDLSLLPVETEIENFVPTSSQALNDYLKMNFEARVREYEEDLGSMISSEERRIRRSDPEIKNEDLTRIVLAKIRGSYKLRELLEKCPDYQVELYPYFLDNE